MMKFLLYLCLIFTFNSKVYAFNCDDEKALKQILKQAKLNFDPAALRSCKTHPENQTQTIIAYAYPDLANHEEVGDYQLIILTMNQQNLRLIDTYKVAKMLRSDGIELGSISLDTAPYEFKSRQRAIGLRLDYSGRSSPNPYSSKVLNLYDLKKKSQILDSLIIKEFAGETDTRCNADIKEQRSTLHMLQSKTHESFDIQVKSQIDNYEMLGDETKCVEVKRNKTNKNFILKFNGS